MTQCITWMSQEAGKHSKWLGDVSSQRRCVRWQLGQSITKRRTIPCHMFIGRQGRWGLSDDNGVLLLSINLCAHTHPSQPLTTICTSPHCAKYLGPLLKLGEGKTINVTHLFPPHLIWAGLHACLRRRRLLLCFHKKWATSLTTEISWWKADWSPHSSNY